MRYALVLLAAWTLTCASSASAEDSSEQGPPGRFQLLQGRYPHWDADKDVMTEKNDLFMIDTTNGETWYYASASKGGKESRYWLIAAYDETKPGRAKEKPSQEPGDKGNGEWQKV